MGKLRIALRWLKRLVLGTLALVLTIVAVALILIHTNWGRNYIRERAVDLLKDAVPGGVQIAEIDGSVFTTLVIRGVEIRGRDGKSWIHVGAIKVKVALAPLLVRTVRVESLEIDDVAIDQHPQPDAPPEPVTPEPPPDTRPSEPSPWTIEVNHVELNEVAATIGSASRTLDFHDLEVYARASIDRGAITAWVGMRGKWADRDVAATAIAHYDRGVLVAPFAAIKVARAHARLLGVRLGDALEGSIAAFVPAVTAEAVADLHLPGDLTLAANAAPDGSLQIRGGIGDATVEVIGQTSFETRSADAIVVAEVPDGTKLDPHAAGRALLTAAVEAKLDGERGTRLRGMIAIDGARPLAKQLLGQDQVKGTALLAVDATLSNLWVMFESGLDAGHTRATAIAELTRNPKDGAIAIAKSTLVASASKLGAAHTDAHVGYLVASATATGPLLPKTALKVSGMIDGDSLRYGAIAVSSVDAQIDTRHVSEANVHVDVGSVSTGKTTLGSATLDARIARDGDGTIIVAIDKHAVTTASNGVWSGTAGLIRIEPTKIVVDNFHTGAGAGSVVANATVDRETGAVHAVVDAKDVALATLSPALDGKLDASVELERHGTLWKGSGTVAGKQVVVAKREPMDVGVAFTVDGRKVELASSLTAPEGKASLAVDLDGPADLTDGAGWKRLERKALRDVTIAVDHFDLAKLGKQGMAGTVNGNLEITATGASGDLALRGFTTSHGVVDADLTLAPDDQGLRGMLAKLSAKLEGVDTATADVWLDMPQRPFDPVQWQSLGKGALHHATVTLAPFDFDPAALAKANVDAPYRGHIAATIDVAEGASAVAATVDVTEVRGGVLAQPVDVHFESYVDQTGARVSADVDLGSRGKLFAKEARAARLSPLFTFNPPQLVRIAGAAPFKLGGSIDEIEAEVAQLATMQLVGTITFPNVPAAQIVGVIGRRDVTAGTLAGTVDFAGTILHPTASANITAHDVTLPPSITGRAPAKLSWLQIAGSWDGHAIELAISGKEISGGALAIAATGDSDHLSQVQATISAKQFDVAPVTAFAVGAVAAAKGTLDANVTLAGLDPKTGDVHGTIDIANGRIPISPLLGTLREAKAHVGIQNHRVDAHVEAKLGKGSLEATAAVALDGSTPSKATAHAVLHDISLVRAFQPQINATLDATFAHDTMWRGDVKVTHGHVVVATTGGVELLPADAPGDMQFTDQAPTKLVPLLQRPPPEKPWLRANIDLQNLGFEVVQDEFNIRGNVAGQVALSMGGGIGMEGTLEATTQNIELLGARAQLDHAKVTWDGTLDPLLDVDVLRELTDLTITASVRGRMSKPEIQLSSDSGAYTQGEMIGYFLGGTPSSNRDDVSQTAAAAGAGAASALVTSQLRKTLPASAAKYAQRVSINYEVGTASTSEALRVGYWISKHVFVAVHSHFEPLPDENANEAIGEWHFRANMMLQGNAGDRGIAGLDLVRRWHW